MASEPVPKIYLLSASIAGSCVAFKMPLFVCGVWCTFFCCCVLLPWVDIQFAAPTLRTFLVCVHAVLQCTVTQAVKSPQKYEQM